MQKRIQIYIIPIRLLILVHISQLDIHVPRYGDHKRGPKRQKVLLLELDDAFFTRFRHSPRPLYVNFRRRLPHNYWSFHLILHQVFLISTLPRPSGPKHVLTNLRGR